MSGPGDVCGEPDLLQAMGGRGIAGNYDESFFGMENLEIDILHCSRCMKPHRAKRLACEPTGEIE